MVQVLFLRTGQIHPAKLEHVHFENGLGLARIGEDSVRAQGPELFDDEVVLGRVIAELRQDGPLTLDVENIFTAVENSATYQESIRAIRSGEIRRRIEKIHLACFVEHLYFRRPKTLAKWAENVAGDQRWVVLAALRQLQSDRYWLYARVRPLMFARWILHVAQRHLFPLGDFAVLRNPSGSRIWCALSPRMLLEICLGEETYDVCSTVPITPAQEPSLMRQYRRLCLSNASGQVISHDRLVLEEWAQSVECKERCRELGICWPSRA